MIVLDTHVWVWWVDQPSRLSPAAAARIAKAKKEGSVYIATISTWELAMLVARGRLKLAQPVAEWVARSESLSCLHFVPLSNAIGIRANAFDDLHGDPADRIIAATASGLGAPLVTKDDKLRKWRGVETVW